MITGVTAYYVSNLIESIFLLCPSHPFHLMKARRSKSLQTKAEC